VENALHKAVEGAQIRLPRWMAVVAALGSSAFLAYGHVRMAAGFALGAGIAILGYRWLERAVGSALDAATGGAVKRLGWIFILRYPLLFGAALLFYETHWLPFAEVLLGLLVPVAGAIMETLFLLGKLALDP
jgi:hypothetical protein